MAGKKETVAQKRARIRREMRNAPANKESIFGKISRQLGIKKKKK